MPGEAGTVGQGASGSVLGASEVPYPQKLRGVEVEAF